MELLQNTLFINLQHRTDRLEHVTKQFEKLGIDFPYIDFVQAFNDSFIHNRLTIKDEVGYEDGHASIEGNKFAAEKIYKFLIENNIFIVK